MTKKIEDLTIQTAKEKIATKKLELLQKYQQIRLGIAKAKNKNIHSIPKIIKIVITSCLGDHFRDKKKFESIKEDITKVALQEPIPIKAKRSVASFSLRSGMYISYKVTLRKDKVLFFIERLIYCGFMNSREFQGMKSKAISGNKKGGFNLNIGIDNISIFPEIPKTLGGKNTGLGITICTNAKSYEDCQELLEGLNIPFVNTLKKEK